MLCKNTIRRQNVVFDKARKVSDVQSTRRRGFPTSNLHLPILINTSGSSYQRQINRFLYQIPPQYVNILAQILSIFLPYSVTTRGRQLDLYILENKMPRFMIYPLSAWSLLAINRQNIFVRMLDDSIEQCNSAVIFITAKERCPAFIYSTTCFWKIKKMISDFRNKFIHPAHE